VTIALVPLTIALFQQVSVVSPLANAVAIPVVSLAVTPLALLGGMFVLMPAPLDSLAVPCLAIAHALFGYLATALHWVAGFGGASIALPAPPPWALGFALAGVLWLLMPRGWPLRWLGLVWLMPLFVWPAQRPAPGELWVTAIDVGQGAAVLLETRDVVVLYDTGPRYTAQADAGGRLILPYLRWRGIGRLDLLVVTHLDSDHSGGAASVLRAMPGTPVFTSIDPAHPMFAGAGRVERCTSDRANALGALKLRFLHPAAADYDERRPTNAMSCVLLAQFGAHRVLLTGDIPARQEAEMLAREALAPITLLAAPHHGSRNSSSQALIAAAQPRWVLFQAGYRNRFGHPDPGVVAAYRTARAAMGRTDHHGALQWRFRSEAASGVTLTAARPQGRRYWHNQPDDASTALRLPETDLVPDDLEGTGAMSSMPPVDVPLGNDP
jgi:competence protein ComEC